MAWGMVGAAAISAGAGIYGAQQAAGAQSDAAKKNAALTQQNMLMQLGLIEPQRQLGYGAQSDLASLYGYNLSPYQSANQLMNPNGAGGTGGGTITVGGRGGTSNYSGIGDLNPFSGGKDKKYAGSIDPATGTVTVNGNSALSAQLTEYLRTGLINGQPVNEKQLNKSMSSRIFGQITNLRSGGWKYDPNAATTQNPASGGQAGNMSRFFASPDYTFRRDEGQRDIGNSFAARGGAASGNALRALSTFNSNLASGEFGNYTNRLMSMAGMGQVANSQAGQAGNNYTQGLQQSNQQQGDARASGVLGTTNSIQGLLGDFAGIYGQRKRTDPMAGLGDIPIWQQRIGG